MADMGDTLAVPFVKCDLFRVITRMVEGPLPSNVEQELLLIVYNIAIDWELALKLFHYPHIVRFILRNLTSQSQKLRKEATFCLTALTSHKDRIIGKVLANDEYLF